MFKIFPSYVAVDTSKITALYIDRYYRGAHKNEVFVVKASSGGDDNELAEFTNEDDAKNYLKKLVAELNAERGGRSNGTVQNQRI